MQTRVRSAYLCTLTQQECTDRMTRRSPLVRTSPESQGIRSSAIRAFVDAVESEVRFLHSFMLLRHGVAVAEGWWAPYGPRVPHLMFSLTKSFTSTAIGMAVGEGLLSIDDRVAELFPGSLPDDATDHARAMRVRHLLSMSTGHEQDTSGPLMNDPDNNHARGFFSVPVVHEPGTHFCYNTGASHLLAVILHKLTGQTLPEYLGPRLFGPLGITPGPWMAMKSGINTGGSGSSFCTEDIARFGQFYLQRGVWKRRRLLSEEWIAQATSKQVANGTDPVSDWAQGYCFQFWRCRHNVFRGDGAFGQYCVVMPEQDAVLAMTGGMGDMQKPLDLVWEQLLPAMSAGALPEDCGSQEALRGKLTGLALAPVQGAMKGAVKGSGRTYVLDRNEQGFASARLTTRGKTATLSLEGGPYPVKLRFGYGTWARGTAVIGREQVARPAAGSCAWIAPDTWRGELWGYTTPYRHSYQCRFAGDSITVAFEQNVAFGSTEAPVLTGHAAPAARKGPRA